MKLLIIVFIGLVVFLLGNIAWGWLLYKMNRCDSLKTGITGTLYWSCTRIGIFFRWVGKGLKWLYHYWCDKAARQHHYPFTPPTNEEWSKLINLLSRHPFETPSFNCYGPNANDIFVIDIGAVGLVQMYRELTEAQLRQMVERIFLDYWRTIRGTIPRHYISIASENRLVIEMPLSEYGRMKLEESIAQAQALQKMDAHRQAEAAQEQGISEDVDLSNIFEDEDLW